MGVVHGWDAELYLTKFAIALKWAEQPYEPVA
jgi:hypothetical protein